MSFPEVSVIIPTFNRCELLKLTLRSVQAQTFKDLEIIIVDDGSKDNTREVIEQLQNIDRRIVYIYQENRGLPSARNTGIKNSHGKYIAFLDSDDLWKLEKIEKQLLIFNQNEEIDVVYTDCIYVDLNGEIINCHVPEDDAHFQHLSLYEKLLYFDAITGSASSVMAKKESIIKTGYFDEKLCSSEDIDYWRRMALHCSFYFLDEYLVLLRVHKNSMTQNLDLLWKGEYQNLIKLSKEMPSQFQFHLPEVAYSTYKTYMKKFFYMHDLRGFFMSIYLLIKIISLGYKYIFRLVKDFFRAYTRKISNRFDTESNSTTIN
jgi:glycosyltransferase involved in cell wall biosynthesis